MGRLTVAAMRPRGSVPILWAWDWRPTTENAIPPRSWTIVWAEAARVAAAHADVDSGVQVPISEITGIEIDGKVVVGGAAANNALSACVRRELTVVCRA